MLRRRSLTQLANNPELIDGIYNYCDRWCERCPFTSRCLVYASEADEEVCQKEQDVANAAFWRELDSVLQDTLLLIPEWATASGFDLTSLKDTSRKRKRQQVDNHPLVLTAKKYANSASDWFRQVDLQQTSDNPSPQPNEQLNTSRDVIQWYQYQIAIKTMRALSGRTEEFDQDTETSDSPKDSDGSAKVALIGIDRSLAAWRLMQLAAPESATSIITLILQLARLRNRTESEFPDARNYIRPGFDEVRAS
jgi:hypothetical protein